jgi:hypothetical protein
MIDHISQCLRPGGLMVLFEFDFRVHDADHKPFSLPMETMEPPWFPRWMTLLNMAVRQRGGTPVAANMLYSWTLQHQAFEDVVHEVHFVPTAPFMSSQEPDYHIKRMISECIRDDILVCDCRMSTFFASSPFAFLVRLFYNPDGHFC